MPRASIYIYAIIPWPFLQSNGLTAVLKWEPDQEAGIRLPMDYVDLPVLVLYDGFLADHDLDKPALDIPSKADGRISTYYGIQTEDGKAGYSFVDGQYLSPIIVSLRIQHTQSDESYEHHKKFMEHALYSNQ